ncbi:hypothetical protein CHARACLAT_003181 [Characodon lateralis]|uniref:Uncharacterized protein n=1 Tax=Characodon lateralis TaxID=208331 RepID=A0ABU7DD85_9TELE|nr:hypothetical protein [Characodon lateralis]
MSCQSWLKQWHIFPPIKIPHHFLKRCRNAMLPKDMLLQIGKVCNVKTECDTTGKHRPIYQQIDGPAA